MKRLLSAALILSLLGGTAAVAAPAGRDYGHSRSNNNGAVIAGVGLLALAAILASSQSHDDYGYRDAYGPPPPPAPEWHAGWHRDWQPQYQHDGRSDWHGDHYADRGYNR